MSQWVFATIFARFSLSLLWKTCPLVQGSDAPFIAGFLGDGRLLPSASFILFGLGVTRTARTARRVPFGRRLGSGSSSLPPRVRQGEFLWCSPGIRQFLFLRNSDSE